MTKPTFAHRLADLLEHPSVQGIRFCNQTTMILPAAFRNVAAAVRSNALKIVYDPVALAANGTLAEYTSSTNTFAFASNTALDTEKGRAVAVHEACHAICDEAMGLNNILVEEGAAYVAQVWYLMNEGASVAKYPADFVAVATSLRNQAAGGGLIPVMTSAEKRSVAAEAARQGYKYGWYEGDGF